MSYSYSSEQTLRYPIEVVFAFFANPENLPRLMPQWQKARIEEASFAPPPPNPDPARRIKGIAAGAGTRLTMSFRPVPLSPLRLPWEAEISEFEWNDHFCDVQVRGPFAKWTHCHRLRPVAEGTLLRDEVEYELPFGGLGRMGQPLIAWQLKSVFRFRHEKTLELLGLMAGRSG